MSNCKPVSTFVDLSANLDGFVPPINDPTLYCNLVGALQYLTFTRLDITYDVQEICLYMCDPWEPHFTALKRSLRYIRGITAYGLQLCSLPNRSLISNSDVDMGGCLVSRQSTSG